MYLNWHWIVLAIPFWIRMNFASTTCDLRWKNCDGKKGRRDRYRTARIKNEPNIWLEWQQNRRTSQTVLSFGLSYCFSCFYRVKVDIMPFHFLHSSLEYKWKKSNLLLQWRHGFFYICYHKLILHEYLKLRHACVNVNGTHYHRRRHHQRRWFGGWLLTQNKLRTVFY